MIYYIVIFLNLIIRNFHLIIQFGMKFTFFLKNVKIQIQNFAWDHISFFVHIFLKLSSKLHDFIIELNNFTLSCCTIYVFAWCVYANCD